MRFFISMVLVTSAAIPTISELLAPGPVQPGTITPYQEGVSAMVDQI